MTLFTGQFLSKLPKRSSDVVRTSRYSSDIAAQRPREAADVTSAAILFSDDIDLCRTWASLLTPNGWRTTITADPDRAIGALTSDVALVLLDSGAVGAADVLARLRGTALPTAGVPVLQHGDARWAGTNALLPPGGAAMLVAAIEVFTGALSDHALRVAPFSPFYRLVRLLGARDAAAMIARFAETLCTALAEEMDSTDQAHRLAGITGALGYTDLSLAWRAAEQDITARGAAVAASRIVLAQIEHDDLARYGAGPLL